MKTKYPDIIEDEINSIIQDIRRYLVNKVDGLETNQQYIRMKALFCRYPIIAQFGTNFQTTKYQESNKILIKLCINYYEKYWKYRNQMMHDNNKQKERIRKWYDTEYQVVLESEYPQVKKFRMRKINKQTSTNKALLKWIYSLRKIKSRSEKYSLSDIRCYFGN